MKVINNIAKAMFLIVLICAGSPSAMDVLPKAAVYEGHDYDQEIKPLLQKLWAGLILILGEDSHQAPKLSVIVGLFVGDNQENLKRLRDNIRDTLDKKINSKIEKLDFDNLEILLKALKSSDFNFGMGQYWTQTQFNSDTKYNYGEKLKNAQDIIEAILKYKGYYNSIHLVDLIRIEDILVLQNKNIQPIPDLNQGILFLDQNLLTKLLRTKLRGSGYADLNQIPYLSDNPNIRENLRNFLSKPVNFSPIKTFELLSHLERAVGGFNPNQKEGSWSGWAVDFKNPLAARIEYEKEMVAILAYIKQLKKTCMMRIQSETETAKEFSEAFKYLLDVQKLKLDEFAAFKNKDEVWILSLDGGGIRGLIGAKIMSDLERKLQQPSPHLTITDVFDYYAGTSTGGLMALGLTMPSKKDPTKPLHNTKIVEELYSKNGDRIFPPIYWSQNTKMATQAIWGGAYSARGLEEILAQYFGNTMLSMTIKPTLVTSVDISHGKATYFSSYAPLLKRGNENELNAGISGFRDVAIWQAARATSAAPAYLPPLTMVYDNEVTELIDGGLFRNNPTALALQEVLKHCKGVKKIVILSIGTGKSLEAKKALDAYNTGTLNLLMDVFVKIGMNQNVADSEKQVQDIIAELKLRQNPVEVKYYRMNPETAGQIDLDGVGEEDIRKLDNAAASYMNGEEYPVMSREILRDLEMRFQNRK